MNNYGHHTMLISGGYDLIANSIGKKAGFKEIRCNTLELTNNYLTGNLENTILDKKRKLFHLRNSIKKLNIKNIHRIAHLIVHGTLHLLGFDHLKKEEENKMKNLENQTLNSLGINYYN